MTQPDPQDIACRAAQRDTAAFAALYEEHLNSVYRFVFFKVGDPTLAEDLTAEVFSKAWENIDRFEWRDLPFQHWLLRVARNVVVDHWRAHRRFPVSLDGLYELPSEALTPDDIVARESEVERVRLGLKSLPDDQRDVLILRFIEGYSHADTSQVLGKSVVAVRQIQVRALRALREVMREGETPFVARDTSGLAALARRGPEPVEEPIS
jgi:RNA polymerase sigma-70 factor (ECF subfamily)